MNYISENIKTKEQNAIIGLIVAKYEDHYYVEYSSDKRIYTKSYKVVI